jgi:hypothetical protein
MVRKECFEEVGLWDEELPFSWEWDMGVRLAARYDYDSIGVPLVIFHRHSDPHQSNSDNRAKGYEIIIRKYAGELELYPRYRGSLLFYLRVYNLKKRCTDQARRLIWSSMRAYPYRPKVLCYLLVSLLGSGPYRFASAAKKYYRGGMFLRKSASTRRAA